MAKKQYKKTFTFFEVEEQAKGFCDSENKNQYIKKNYPAHYTPWVSQDGMEHKFIAWYVTK